MTASTAPTSLERPGAAAADAAPARALTGRALVVSLAMVLLWTVGTCLLACHPWVLTQQMFVVLGFGAILTLFLLQFPWVFVATVTLVWIGTAAQLYLAAPPGESGRIAAGLLRSLVLVVPLLAMGVWLARRRLTRGERVVVYACVLIAIPWCICIKSVLESSIGNLMDLHKNSEAQLYAWARQLPWWGPTVPPQAGPVPDPAQAGATLSPDAATDLAVQGFTRGYRGSNLSARVILGLVPWSMWWRPILYWTGMCLAFQAMLMGLLLMFRKRWIEHERLPFVWAYPAINLLQEDYKRHIPARRAWVMFALGVAICVPGIFYASNSGDFPAWTAPPWVGQEGLRGGVDLTSLNILPGVTLRLYWGPLILALFLLMPVDTLLTIAGVYMVVNMFLPGILRAMGLTLGPAYVGAFTKWGLRSGGCMGLLIWSVVFNARTIWGYVRSLWGRKPTDAESTDELGRPLIVAMTVLGLGGFLALGWYATGAAWAWQGGQCAQAIARSGAIQILLLAALVLVFAFAQVRQRIEGMPMTYDNNIGSHMMVSIQRDFLHDHYSLLSEGGPPVAGTSWASHWLQWGFSGQLKSFGPHNMLLEAFKVGHELRVHARDIAKAIALTMLVVAVVTPLLYLQLMYLYGFENSYQGTMYPLDTITQWSERGASYGLHSTSTVFKVAGEAPYRNTWFHVWGIVIIGILFWLRREYPRFPISPVGVVLGAEYFSSRMPVSPDLVWFSFLAAGVFKAMTFRWLGVRSFREKIQPAVVMLLCGMILGIMLYLFRYISLGLGRLE